MHHRRPSAAVFISKFHRWALAALLAVGTAACGPKMHLVNPDAALNVGTKFWQSLRVNDVATSVDMYAPRVWSTEPAARARWSGFLTALNHKFGPVTAAELKGKKWFPGSKLVADHRAFVCYSYDYAVTRETLVSQERLIACADPGAAVSAMQVYGHRITRPDTQQTVAVGIDFEERPFP